MASNKTVFISGGASGIGYLCGECYAKEGANVVLLDINEKALNECVEKIKEITDNVMGCVVDVLDYAQVERARDEAVARFGSIDILIVTAGGAETRLKNAYAPDFTEVDIEVVDFGLDLNLKGALHVDHAVMRQMAKQGSGVVVNLGSITGEEGCAVNVAYSASKSALMNGVVKSLAMCGGKHGIRAVCVAPGPVLTRPGMANMKTLMGRAAETQEIVDMIMYVASDKGAFITGTTILMDGGRNVLRNK